MSMSDNPSLDEFVTIIKALSDANRVRALCALRKGELCVCQITELLGLAPSTISKHMSILKQAKLVDSRKSGRWVYYRPAEKNNGHGGGIIELLISALVNDEQIRNDDTRMECISATCLEELCKRQRSDHER